jgi:hypothetical protein
MVGFYGFLPWINSHATPISMDLPSCLVQLRLMARGRLRECPHSRRILSEDNRTLINSFSESEAATDCENQM